MAVSHRFRGSLSGFNRKDVVQYIEYLNTTHTAQVNQLTEEADQLRKELEAAKAASDKLAELEAAQQELIQARDAAVAEVEALKQTVAQLTAEQEKSQEKTDSPVLPGWELDAYRRAEQAERRANERAEQIYLSAVSTLAHATNQVDTAAEQFGKIADQVSSQMSLLQNAVELGKNALQDAATTMYSIRPENKE